MRVLVTGATGFVGRVVCARLSGEHIAVVAAARGDAAGEPPLAGTTTAESRLERLDLASPGADLRRLVDDVDVVVHLAARAHISEAATAREQYFALNTLATERLAYAARHAGVRRFVFASSAKIYGESSGAEGFAESVAPRPRGAYAESKWEAERVLHRIAGESGLEVVILRPPLIYGPGVKGNLLQLVAAIAKRRPLPLADIQNRRSLLGVQNFADAIVRCLLDPRAAGQTFNVSDPVPLSTTDLAREIAAALGRPPRLWAVPSPLLAAAARAAGRSQAVDRLTTDFVLDITRISHTLQWQAPVPRSHGIALMADWYENLNVVENRPSEV